MKTFVIFWERLANSGITHIQAENVNWHDSELQDGFIVYEATCDDCDTEFQEEYKLIYAVTTYNEIMEE